MPVYDFKCLRCGNKFTVLVPMDEKGKVECPQCRGKEITQLFTGFGIGKGGGSSCDISDSTKRFGGG